VAAEQVTEFAAIAGPAVVLSWWRSTAATAWSAPSPEALRRLVNLVRSLAAVAVVVAGFSSGERSKTGQRASLIFVRNESALPLAMELP
jgi:hypothetical protein